ncbi:SSI family serine proteinase inhibitor [Sphaerisporangium viridialbum]|uniref:SSI family serine proteinase inhibitor n=1 Tax=Sphaerisporangium viridialbum TaxID=46189 RepID=UPI003C75BFE5
MGAGGCSSLIVIRDRGIHLRRIATGLSCLALVLGAAVAAGPAAGASSAWDPPPGAPALGDQPWNGPTPPPAPHIWPIPTPPPGPDPGPPPAPHIKPPPEPHIGPGPGPGGSPDRRARTLVLTRHRGATPLPADRVVTLRCSPPGGTHPSAASACRALIGVGGDPSRLDLSPGIHCPRIYNPVTVTAVGSWDGRRITVRHTYGNPCTLRAHTGPVYDF